MPGCLPLRNRPAVGLLAVLLAVLLTGLLAVLIALPARAGATTAPPAVRFEVSSPAARDVAVRCAGIWQQEGAELTARLLPAGTPTDTVLCLVLDTSAFARTFAGTAPDWGVGIALGHGRLVALDYSRLPAVGRGAREVFLHEMVHALLFQGTQGAWLPAWLHEGAAMRYTGEWRFVDTVSLILDGRLPDLSGLQGPFPGSAHRADRAYRTSLLAVDRLLERHGPGVVGDLVAATARTGDFSQAFLEVTGTTDVAYYADFAGAMRLRYGWAVLLTRWPGLFVLMGLVLLVGGARKLVLSRRRLAAMDDGDPFPPDPEAPDPPAGPRPD